MSPRTSAVSGALLLALAGPAVAQAATIEPLAKPCYVTAQTPAGPQAENIQIVARDFTPNSLVDLALDGRIVSEGAQTDANGEIGVMSPLLIPTPVIAKGSDALTISLTEQGNPANSASVTTRRTALRVGLKPRTASPSAKVRFSGSGFTLDKPVYAHYVFKGRLRKTVKLSGDPGACGVWSKRAKQIPVAARIGVWTVQFDQLKKYRRPSADFPTAFVTVRISVTRG